MNVQRYLSAKRTVDDRALNRRVEARLADELRDSAVDSSAPLRVLEVGAGTGATVERLLAREWLPDRVDYTALDLDRGNVAAARERLPVRASALGYAVGRAGDRPHTGDRGHAGDRFVCSRGQRRVEVEFRTADAFDFIAESDREFDLAIAHAFVDLVDPADALAAFRNALAPDGLAYCPITYDGETAFESVADREPERGADRERETDREFEDRLLDAFHRHLDRSGDSRAGRHLLAEASERDDAEVLAAGGSDWVVRPRDGASSAGEASPGDGVYPADEAYFLRCIVGMVESAVGAASAVRDDRLSAWADRRRDQVADAELVYVAHQLDLLIR